MRSVVMLNVVMLSDVAPSSEVPFNKTNANLKNRVVPLESFSSVNFSDPCWSQSLSPILMAMNNDMGKQTAINHSFVRKEKKREKKSFLFFSFHLLYIQ